MALDTLDKRASLLGPVPFAESPVAGALSSFGGRAMLIWLPASLGGGAEPEPEPAPDQTDRRGCAVVGVASDRAAAAVAGDASQRSGCEPMATLTDRRTGATLLLGDFGLSFPPSPDPGEESDLTVHVPDSIDATGTADVTDALNDWMASVPNGRANHPTIIRLGINGTYRAEDSIVLSDRRHIVFDGNGATLRSLTEGDQKRRHFVVHGGSDIVIRDLTVRGANLHAGADRGHVDALEEQHAFALYGVDGIELDGVKAFDIYGDFVYFGQNHESNAQQIAWSHNVHVHDFEFARNGRQGMCFNACDDVLVENGTIDEVALTIFDIEPGLHGGCRRLTIQDLPHVGKARDRLFSGTGGPEADVGDITLQRLTLVGQPLQATFGVRNPGRRDNFTLSDCTSNTISRAQPVRLFRVDGATITGNDAPVSGRLASAVRACNCTDVNVDPGQFSGATADLVYGSIPQFGCTQ